MNNLPHSVSIFEAADTDKLLCHYDMNQLLLMIF